MITIVIRAVRGARLRAEHLPVVRFANWRHVVHHIATVDVDIVVIGVVVVVVVGGSPATPLGCWWIEEESDRRRVGRAENGVRWCEQESRR